MELSVIIPTHNRAETLPRTLAALARQSLSAASFEVLVVDDGSTPDQRSTVRDVVARHGFRLLEQDQGGLASARNHGAEHAAGRILWFLDDDVVPGPDAAAQHLASHAAAGEPAAVVGSLPFPEDIPTDAFLWYLKRSGHYDLYANPRKYKEGRPPMPPLNGNSSVPRSLFHDIGRYDASFRQYGGEDLELGHRLARAGVPFVYNPRAVGVHHHVKRFDRFCTDMERAGESLIRLYRKYPEIKGPKKIDLVEDPYSALPLRKQAAKLVMSLGLGFPAILALPRLLIRLSGERHALRHVLFPLYRWVAYTHYAAGMRRGLRGS